MLQFLTHLVRYSKSHVGDLSQTIGCFLWFYAFFIACFSTDVYHADEGPLPKYGQVLRLGPVFFPNRSGIKLFGSTNRMRDLVSI